MLKGYKDPGTLVAEIRMTRINHNGAFLVVEGANDFSFWLPKKNVDCELVDGEGKNNVVGCVQRLDSVNFSGVLGVVDSDFDSINNIQPCSDNLVPTDAHDLECLLCRSSALDTVLAEFGNWEKIQNFEQQGGVDVRTSLLNRAVVFGRLRWAMLNLGLSVSSSLIRVPRFVDYQSWTIKDAEMISAVEHESTYRSNLSEYITSLPPADPWHVAHGTDMIELLRIGLMHVLGELASSTGPKSILQVLRAAISTEELKTTGFGAGICNWESRNRPYKVLPP